jgi:beta-N-acetylhexosaminidase
VTRKIGLFITNIVLLVGLLCPTRLLAQNQSGDPFVEQLLSQMTVEEKVGQLFLITFVGNDLSEGSDIVELVTQYRVGGVVLLASNENFTNNEDTPRQVTELTRQLQEWAFVATQPPQTTSEGTATPTPAPTGQFIPLFVAVDHEGDGYPYTRITGGVTNLPNNMALGATWKESNAETIGQIVGQELAAMGINLLFGPPLDVLDNPRPGLRGDLGTRCFGGDPYWVSKFGQAYIRGVHAGGDGRVATVAKHFPGHGGSDRRADEEVSTVSKSLQELLKVELPPFIAVTDPQGADPLAITDALMTSHIRYRGFQGNIRETTRPVSFDPQAMQALMSIPALGNWRDAGGVIVSDALGVPAVRKHYDPKLESFNHRRIAQEAFYAGNDLLVLSQFDLHDSWSAQMANIKDTITWFRERYVNEPSFQARVDDSLRRILQLKHRLYPQFTLDAVRVDPEQLADKIGQSQSVVTQMAQESVSLIYPGRQELDRLPPPPVADENILIFTDDRQARDCSDCPSYDLISPRALQDTIVQLYGPKASGQVDPARIHSMTFSQLMGFLGLPTSGSGTEESSTDVEDLIRTADWIIFAMLDHNPQEYPQSDALKSFLRLRADTLRGKKVVVIAYNAPYYLDTTEISKLTAYYCVYSKINSYIGASVRALFQEFPPQEAPPVSVDGVSYNLIVQLEPDPNQSIRVMRADVPPSAEGTPVPVEIGLGDTLRLRTNVILDHNGHPVPDGTPVEFRFYYVEEGLELREPKTTVDGVAHVDIALERSGQLEISVTGSPPTMLVNILGDKPAIIETVVPTPSPTSPPTPSPAPTSLPTPRPTLSPAPAANRGWLTLLANGRVDGAMLFISLLGIAAVGSTCLAVQWVRGRPLAQGLRLGLWTVIAGLAAYELYALNAPGVALLQDRSGRWGVTLFSLTASLVPLLISIWSPSWTHWTLGLFRRQN